MLWLWRPPDANRKELVRRQRVRRDDPALHGFGEAVDRLVIRALPYLLTEPSNRCRVETPPDQINDASSHGVLDGG